MVLLVYITSVQLNAQGVALKSPKAIINNNKGSGTPGLLKSSANLVGYWKMDDGSGTIVSDEVGSSDGSLINPGDNIWVDGYIGKALDFTSKGVLDTSVFVQIPGANFDFPSTESFSFSVIVKLPKTSSSEQSILSKGMPFVTNGGWYHLSYKGTAARFMVWDQTNLPSPAGKFPEFYPENDWVNLVCVRDVEKDSLFVYMNGFLLDKIKDFITGEISNDGDLFLGTVPNFKTGCKGAIDEVQIYDGALTPQEIKDLAKSYGFDPITDLAGYWKMDDGAGTKVSDELGMSDGTLINPGDNIWVDGYIGKALDFTSKGALDTSVFVQIPGVNVDFNSAESFSFSTIVKLEKSASGEQSILSKGMPFVNTGGWYHLSYKGQAARFMVWDQTNLPSPDGKFPKFFPENDWVHLVCVRDVQKDSMFVYLNGVLLDKCKDIITGEISNDGDLFIGTVPSFKTDCKGAIDEVKIFKKALSAEEILQQAKDYGFTPISSLVGYWKMDDGAGTTVSDELGMSDGTIINPGDAVWVDGYVGKALDFTSKGSLDTSEFVQIPGAKFDFPTTKSFSFSTIVKLPKSYSGEQSILSKGMPFVDNGGWYHLSYKGKAARFMVWDKTNLPSPDGKFPNYFPEMDWVHFVCVRDVEKDSMFVYMNGVLLDACKDIIVDEVSNDGDLYIGTVPSFKTDCHGAIDEVKIYQDVLTPAEVLSLSQSYGFKPLTNVAGYWKMDDGSGTTVSDELGISDGTLINPGDAVWVDGYIGKALDFTSKGVLDTSVFVQIPGAAANFTTAESFSFSVIAKLDKAGSGEQSILSKGMPFVDNGGWYHLSYKGGAARFMVWDKTNLPSPAGVFPADFPEKDWVNIVCVRDVEKDSMFVYLNGILLDKCKDIIVDEIANDGDLYIGTVPSFKTDCKGAIDEVKIFKGALTDAEILAIAQDYGFDPIPTAIASIKTGPEVSIYPNPVSQKLYIKNAGNSVISVYSMNGTLMRTFTNTEKDAELNVSEMHAGIYILKIQTNDNVRVSNFMKE
jgi:hypothetical protein